ncbi:hypothetical protein BAE44_0017755 [Dichanthelium oligosanthes]|uniref:ALOG domain-containing protein n=1 Tax=Dichanthelium oligosanthes TaxID=888268 RepID=A0A1E5V7S3_9POAL|nr:hypothetical protein BAE44_0017755 [Dichanthelium oligosanthes]
MCNHRPPLKLSQCSGYGSGSINPNVGQPRRARRSLLAAFEEHGGRPEDNPFGARAVRLYLRETRGIGYEKNRRKRSFASSSQQSQQQAMALPLQATAPAASSQALSDAATERADDARAAHVLEPGHPHRRFFIPHTRFLHGFSLVPGGSNSGSSAGVGAGNGDEIALAIAAPAEAHAAGCMMLLSVFN